MTESETYNEWRAQITRRAEAMEGAAVDSANQAMKALLLLNGGACIAILGFLASTVSDPSNQEKARLTYAFIHSLLWFGGGAGFAVGTSCLAYLCNSAYARGLIEIESKSIWVFAVILNWVAVVSGLASLAGFWLGLCTLYRTYF